MVEVVYEGPVHPSAPGLCFFGNARWMTVRRLTDHRTVKLASCLPQIAVSPGTPSRHSTARSALERGKPT
jgi:hypothetical protein